MKIKLAKEIVNNSEKILNPLPKPGPRIPVPIPKPPIPVPHIPVVIGSVFGYFREREKTKQIEYIVECEKERIKAKLEAKLAEINHLNKKLEVELEKEKEKTKRYIIEKKIEVKKFEMVCNQFSKVLDSNEFPPELKIKVLEKLIEKL